MRVSCSAHSSTMGRHICRLDVIVTGREVIRSAEGTSGIVVSLSMIADELAEDLCTAACGAS